MMSKQEPDKRELAALGYVISIAGMLLAALAYLFLDIGRFFNGLEGVLGLSGPSWAIIGGVIWIFIIMALLVPVVLRVGIRK
jgi:hypothetical protein